VNSRCAPHLLDIVEHGCIVSIESDRVDAVLIDHVSEVVENLETQFACTLVP
jgi:hypothetical protein